MKSRFVSAGLVALGFVVSGQNMVLGGDWPQFLGPDRNGVSPESIATTFPKDGPAVLWKTKAGEGFSGPVVAGGTTYLFHREGEREVVSAYDSTNGKPRWRNELPTSYSDDFGMGDGPKATPAVANNRIFAFGPAGHLRAVSTEDGKLLWQLDCAKRFGAEKGFFGFASSPLAIADRVIVQVGGDGAGVVAFASADGKVLWKSGSDEAGYGSPAPLVADGKTNVICFNRAGAVALDLTTGAEVFRFPWRSRMNASVNAASPVVSKAGVFVTASYGTGAALFKPAKGDIEPLWSGDESLSAHFATPVETGGFLYGFHGRQESGPDFRCVELATGNVRWSLNGFGSGSVLRAGGQLLVMMESGELRLFSPNPGKPLETARFQICGSGTRALPALADGRLYVRDRANLICLKMN